MSILFSKVLRPSKLRTRLLFEPTRSLLDRVTNLPLSKPLKIVNNVRPSDHFLVLPEPINSEESTNEILRIPKDGEPEVQISKIDTESLFRGLSSRMISFSNFITDMQNEIIPPHESMELLIKDIEKYHYPLENAFYLASLLRSLDSPVVKYKEIDQLLDKCYRMRSEHRTSHFKNKLLSLQKSENPQILRLLSYYFMNNPKNVNIVPHELENLNRYLMELKEYSRNFSDNLDEANKNFSLTVDDPDILAAVSPNLNQCRELHQSDRTPLKIDISTYDKFMESCPDRAVRKDLWLSYKKRCSPKGPSKLNNMKGMSFMRGNKRNVANSLGFRSNLDLKLVGCMVKSRQELVSVLENLNHENKAKLADRLSDLNEFAVDDNMPDPTRLGIQEYDLDYYTYRYKWDILVGKPEAEVKSYFPLSSAIMGIHKFLETYFGLALRPIHYDEMRPPIGPLQVFSVSRNGNNPLGNIILDTQYRGTSRFSYSRIRARNNDLKSLHSRLLQAPFKRDPKTNEAQLSFNELCNLVYLYGTVMQRLLYNYDIAELNLFGGLEFDAQNLLPTLCVAYLHQDYRVLHMCRHRDGSKQMDADLASRLVRAHTYLKPLKNWKELYMARLDVDVQSFTTDMRTMAADVYNSYTPFERHEEDYDFCSMTDIMGNVHDGHRYFGLWSKLLANFWLSNCLKCDSDSQLSSMEVSSIRDKNSQLLDTLFDPQEFDTHKKLESLVGRPFEPTKATLGLL